MQSIFEVSQNYEDDGNPSVINILDTVSNSFLDENYMLRIQTAPARPVTELEEFKRYPPIKFNSIDHPNSCS